jgi:hypothetical protein
MGLAGMTRSQDEFKTRWVRDPCIYNKDDLSVTLAS